MPAQTKFEFKLGAATREAFGRTLVELGRENKDVVVVDADLSKSTMTHLFRQGVSRTGSSPSASPKQHGGGRARDGIWRARFRSSPASRVFVINKGFEQLRVGAAYGRST